MPSLLALTGLNIDRPYPELGAGAADRRRSVAMTLLLGAISQAKATNANALVIVGGLFDEHCASPLSLVTTSQILDAYLGAVLIAPGADAEGMYASTSWGSRTFVWSARDFTGAPGPFSVVHGRTAERGWHTPLPALSDNDEVKILLDVNLDLETSADWTGGSGKRHVITTGTVEAALDGVTVLTPVNPDIGASWGRAALLTYDESEVVGVDWLPLSDKPPAETVEVDVSDLRTTDQLLAAVDRAIAVAPEWSVIRLAGELSQGVMLPTTAEHVPPRADVAIHTDDVHFGFAAPDKSDHTALAEFVRSLSDADVAPRTRHQAIALGIAALDPTYALVNES